MRSGLALRFTIVGLESDSCKYNADVWTVDVVTDPRYEDFEITYHNKNPWAMLGMGYSMKNHQKIFSQYLSLDQIDPKWLEACGCPTNQVIEKHGAEMK